MTENITKKLEGKTIKKAWIEKINDKYDDEPFLFLEMTDGTVFRIIANYYGYTGNSEDEYPRVIIVEEINKNQ